MSKKLTLNAAGDAVTIADATLTDVFSTLLSSDVALTGMYKYAQEAVIGLGAAVLMNKRHSGEFFNFG